MGSSAQFLARYLSSIDAHDIEGVRSALAEDAEVVAPGVELHGADAVTAWIQVFIRAFPDLRHEVHSVLEVDGGYAAEVRFSGTHTGPLASPQGDIAPTGKAFTFDYVDVGHQANGRVRVEHIYFDQLGFLSQLGLLPG